jgi:hypothetical protein
MLLLEPKKLEYNGLYFATWEATCIAIQCNNYFLCVLQPFYKRNTFWGGDEEAVTGPNVNITTQI